MPTWPTRATGSSHRANDLPGDVRRGALTAMVNAHERALATLRARAFSSDEARAIGTELPIDGPARQAAPVGEDEAMTDVDHEQIFSGFVDIFRTQESASIG